MRNNSKTIALVRLNLLVLHHLQSLKLPYRPILIKIHVSDVLRFVAECLTQSNIPSTEANWYKEYVVFMHRSVHGWQTISKKGIPLLTHLADDSLLREVSGCRYICSPASWKIWSSNCKARTKRVNENMCCTMMHISWLHTACFPYEG